MGLPAGSTPSGRGFSTGSRYYLPLSSAEVAAVDLDAGKIMQTSKSREGRVPGNLVCYQGKVISQSWDGVEVFFQADALREEIGRRLAAKPEDAEALRLRGEVLLDEGKLADAVGNLRRAYQLVADERTRELLRDSLLEGLRTDFAGYRGKTEEIERLLDDPAQRATYLRLMADGLQKAGQRRDGAWTSTCDWSSWTAATGAWRSIDRSLLRAARPMDPLRGGRAAPPGPRRRRRPKSTR